VNAVDVEKIIEREIARIQDLKVKNRILRDLIKPKRRIMHWAYSNEKFLCWEICRFTKEGREDVGIVFCEEGANLGGKFLLICCNDSDIGMDSSWYQSLKEIYEEEMSGEKN